MTTISIQSHYGGAATFGIGRGLPSASLPTNQSARSGGTIPSISAYGSQNTGASGAISKIIDIISNMDDSKTSDAGNSVSKNQRHGIEQFNRMMEWANYTKEDVVEQLKAGTLGGHHHKMNAREIALQNALINGTAKVIDMEELGYHTEASFNVHFDGNGNFSGSSITHQRNDTFDLNKFYEEHMIEQPDGTVIDGETGHFADRIKIGGIDLYITWP